MQKRQAICTDRAAFTVPVSFGRQGLGIGISCLPGGSELFSYASGSGVRMSTQVYMVWSDIFFTVGLYEGAAGKKNNLVCDGRP